MAWLLKNSYHFGEMWRGAKDTEKAADKGTKRGCRFEEVGDPFQKHRMKTPNSFMNKAAPKWVIQKARRINVSPLVASLFFAFALTAVAGLVAVRLSQKYYLVAPHHYDSATYRLIAYQFYNLFQSQGLSTALAGALQSKDSFDIIARLLLAPRLLLHPYGHLSVLLPLMGLFILLVMNYVFTRRGLLLIVGRLFSQEFCWG